MMRPHIYLTLTCLLLHIHQITSSITVSQPPNPTGTVLRTKATFNDVTNINCIRRNGGDVTYTCQEPCNSVTNCRAKSMEAILTPKLIKTGACGSGPYASAEPPGFALINKIAPSNAARGHLLAKQLGGSGIDIRNIVPLFSHTNSVVMTRWEGLLSRALANAIPANDKVKYTVRAEYCAAPGSHPLGLWLEAVYITGNPATYANWFKVWLPNEQRKKGYVLFDFTSQLGFRVSVTPVPIDHKTASLRQNIPFLPSTGGPPYMPTDIYPSPSAEAAGSGTTSAAGSGTTSRQLTSASNQISCSFSCPLFPSPSPSPMPSESPQGSASPDSSSPPNPSPPTPNPSGGGGGGGGGGGFLVTPFGFVTGLFIPFFGQECVKDHFPVQLLKESGYTGCRFCSNIEFLHFAVCDSPDGNGKQMVNVMKVLNDEHGLIECDLAALKRNSADISQCESSSSGSCAVECANCKSGSARFLSDLEEMEMGYSNVSSVTNRQVQGICNRDVCCASSCGTCGGSGCGTRPGGASNCCGGKIARSGVVCGTAPCVLSDGNNGGTGGSGSTGGAGGTGSGGSTGGTSGTGSGGSTGGGSTGGTGGTGSGGSTGGGSSGGGSTGGTGGTGSDGNTGGTGGGSGSGGSGSGGSGNGSAPAVCNSRICCPASCGTCGGSGCGTRPGGVNNCCTSRVLASGKSCDSFAPPCIGSIPAPAPAPAPSSSPAVGQPGTPLTTNAPTPTQSIPRFNAVC